MSTITTNPYAIGYSTSDLSTTYPATTSTSTTTSSTSSTTTSATTTGSVASVLTAATGLDTNSLINSSMAGDEAKLANLVRTAQVTTWTQDRYRSTISSLDTFSNSYFDILSDNYVLSPSSFSTSSATPSSTAATATASSSAAAGDYTITSATVATAAKVTGDSTNTSGLKNTSAISTLLTKLGISATSTSTTFSLSSTATDATAKSYTYNITGTDTVSKVCSDLSKLTGYTFNYSELSGKFSVANSSTGASGLTFSVGSDAFMTGIFDGTSTTTTAGVAATATSSTSFTATGNDATFNIKEPNGASGSVTQSSNILTMDGVTYNLAKNVDASAPVTISVATDVSSAMTKIQDFVTNYNNLISSISSVTSEKKNSSYKALSSTQEASMSASAITAWNQKAQAGLLNGDSTLNTMLSEMRTAFYTTVQGAGISLSSVGLSTSNDYTDGGKITVDTAKLKAALNSDPQKVINLFSQVSTTTPAYSASLTSSALKTRSSEEGIFQRISDIYNKYAGTGINSSGNRSILLEKAGKVDTTTATTNSLSKQITTQTKSITDYQAKMTLDKTRYTKIYTALQTAISKLNSQSNSISSMFSSSSSS